MGTVVWLSGDGGVVEWGTVVGLSGDISTIFHVLNLFMTPLDVVKDTTCTWPSACPCSWAFLELTDSILVTLRLVRLIM